MIEARINWHQKKSIAQSEVLAELLQAAYARRPLVNRHALVDRSDVLAYARRGEWWLVKSKIWQTKIADEDATAILNAITLLE